VIAPISSARRAPRCRVAALLVATVLAGPVACGAAPNRAPNAASPAAGRRIVLVGLDAADWLTIDPLLRSGALPTLARLKAVGHTGRLRATPPLISPILWTTIATGHSPEDHGVLDFMVDLPGGTQVPVGSANRLVPAIWNLFSDAGRRVAVVGWWATWPAEQVRGVVVSDALAPQLTRPGAPVPGAAVSPPAWLARATQAVVQPSALTYADLSAYVPLTRTDYDGLQRALAGPAPARYQNRLAHLAVIMAATRTYAAAAEELLRTERPDLVAVYLEAIDTISHLFVRDRPAGPRAITRAYQDADALIRRLAEASPPDTLVVVCSDHGFYPPTAAIAEDPSNLTGPATAWHRPDGIVGAATAGALTGRSDQAAPVDGPSDVGAVTPLDIAPTLLHAAGLPVTRDMPGRVVTALLPREAAARRVERVPARPFVPPPIPSGGGPEAGDAWARLQALGYVGAVKTSLARQNLGEILYRRGKLAEAERELRAVLEAQPSNLTALLWLAKALAGQKRPAEAVRVYERAVALPGGARDGLVEAVELAVAAHDLEGARRLVAAAAPGRDAAAAVEVARGTLAQAARDMSAAERHYRAALRADPLSFDAAARLLELVAARGRAADALPLLARAVELAPDSARHVALYGEARLAARDAAGAEATLTRALALAPDADRVRLALTRARLAQGRHEAAISALLEIGPSAERDVLLGAAYSSAGRWAEAAASLETALAAGMVTADVLNGLGWAEIKLGHPERARGHFARSLELKADQPEIRKLAAGLQPAPGGPAR